MPPALVFSGLLFGRGGVLGLLGVFFAGFPCGLCLGGSRRVKDAGGRLLLGADALIGGRLFLGARLAGEGSVLGSGLAPFSGGRLRCRWHQPASKPCASVLLDLFEEFFDVSPELFILGLLSFFFRGVLEGQPDFFAHGYLRPFLACIFAFLMAL